MRRVLETLLRAAAGERESEPVACMFCKEQLRDGESVPCVAIAIDAEGNIERSGAHRECMFRNVWGCAQHIERMRAGEPCDNCVDDPSLTPREQAIAAWEAWGADLPRSWN